MCRHRKKVMSSQASISINFCTDVKPVPCIVSLNPSKYSSEPKNFLRGLYSLNLLLRGSDPPALLTIATLTFLLIMFPAGSYDIHPEHNKMASDYNLFSRESKRWYPFSNNKCATF